MIDAKEAADKVELGEAVATIPLYLGALRKMAEEFFDEHVVPMLDRSYKRGYIHGKRAAYEQLLEYGAGAAPDFHAELKRRLAALDDISDATDGAG